MQTIAERKVKVPSQVPKTPQKRFLSRKSPRYGNGWGTTDKGAKFSMWHKGVLNSDAWHPEIVDEIVKYLKNK